MPDSSPVIYLVDDDAALLDSMRWLLESADMKVRACGSAAEFLETYEKSRPGCVVLDVRMPGMGGIELQEQMRRREISVPVIVTSAFGDVSTTVRAMKLGALDFLEKPFSDDVLLDRIHKALEIDDEQRANLAQRDEMRDRWNTLTAREKDVGELVVAGMSNKVIASRLGVSVKTVEAHRAKVMSKMKASSVAELVRMDVAREDVDDAVAG
ncbi:MAG TPA: response regulator [Planctomycetota bacterium]